jgi:hypothetical protein
MTTGLFLLKYLSWALTIGIPFVSTWFFDFTKTDKETGKKSLTPVGAKAIYLAGLALICALTVSLWTDYNASAKEKAASQSAATEKAAAEQERSRAREFQMKLNSAQDEIRSGQNDIRLLLQTMNANFRSLPDSQKENVRNAVQKLSSVKDYQEQYPDLFEKMVSARDYDELKDAINTGIWRKIAERVKRDDPQCAGMRINRFEPGLPKGYPGATFDLESEKSKSDHRGTLIYRVDGEGVTLDLSVIPTKGWDPSAAKQMLDKGYFFEFKDGSKSGVLKCEAMRTTGSCHDHTGRGGRALAVYELLQSKPIANVIIGDWTFPVSSAESDTVLKTLRCIAP